jgi:sterol desaturase/sphingolipid hydroxylase (fatty acid hydroxylase superfamily)
MTSVVISMVIIPGAVALLVFLLFSYLFEQSRKPYFRAWQLGWAAYVLHYAADAWNYYHAPSAIVFSSASY